MKVLARKNIWFTFSGLLCLASILLWISIGFRYGIDFTGGSLIEIEYQNMPRPLQADVAKSLEGFDFSNQLSAVGEDGYIARFKELSEAEHQDVLKALNTTVDATNSDAKLIEKRFDSIGPVVGQELKQKSVLVMILVLLGIIFYIAYSFRKVSYPVSSWKYGLAAIISLFHDVLITIGIFILLGHYLHWEIGTSFVAAIMTVLGYSVNDTIVVFDRIRENLHKYEGSFESIVERSINETIRRSINTSLTVILALAAVYFFGGESIKPFALPLLVGVIFGTYSSIFLASPLLVLWHNLGNKLKSK